MSEIAIVQKKQQYALCESRIVRTLGLGNVMTPIYESITEFLKRHDIELGDNCMPFARYNDLNWEELNKKGLLSAINLMFFYKWDLSIGVTCPDSISPEGNLEKLNIIPGDYLCMIHNGPYQKVGETYAKILEYGKRQKIRTDNYSIEFYLNDPRKTPKNLLKTEVLVPILK